MRKPKGPEPSSASDRSVHFCRQQNEHSELIDVY